MPFQIVRQDITKMQVDVIVNAANRNLLMGSGVCGAIFRAAGPEKLTKACENLSPIETGEAVITPGFDLPAKYVIHTAGPVYRDWTPAESEKRLTASYRNSLELAKENGCTSIAFPLISSGIYGYPKDEALQVATRTILSFLEEQEMEVYLAVFDREAFASSQKLMGQVESYIDQNYVDERKEARRDRRREEIPPTGEFSSEALSVDAIPTASKKTATSPNGDFLYAESVENSPLETSKKSRKAGAGKGVNRLFSIQAEKKSLDDLVGNLDEPFHLTLLRLIDVKGKTDVQVYKRANIDRKLFSKIRAGKGYMPGKRTILALAIALELSLDETEDLLERAGFALSHSQKFDIIVEYFIINQKYDIFEINEVLFQYDQPLLGSGT